MARGTKDECNKKAAKLELVLDTGKSSSSDEEDHELDFNNNDGSFSDNNKGNDTFLKVKSKSSTSRSPKKNFKNLSRAPNNDHVIKTIQKQNDKSDQISKINTKASHRSSSSSSSSSSSLPSQSKSPKQSSKLSKSTDGKNLISEHTLTTSSSMTFTSKQISRECFSSNAQHTCCCCPKIEEIMNHLRKMETLISRPQARAAAVPVVYFSKSIKINL